MLLLIVIALVFSPSRGESQIFNGAITSNLTKIDPKDDFTVKLSNETILPVDVVPSVLRHLGPDSKTTKGLQLSSIVKHPKTTNQPRAKKAKRSESNCRCGIYPLVPNLGPIVLDSDTKIVGGFNAPKGSIPHQVGLWGVDSSAPFCGGTLISPRFVLTAAHCITLPPREMKVAIGDSNTQLSDGEIFIQVSSALVHPKYNNVSQDFDFGLIKLSKEARKSSTVNFACLPSAKAQMFVDTSVVVSGWGDTTENGTQSDVLKAVYIKTVSNRQCMQTGYGSQITPSMICASNPAKNKDTCQGDSGGPMVTKLNQRITTIGVTSWGNGCAHPPFIGVYSRVTAARSWILKNSDAGKCQL